MILPTQCCPKNIKTTLNSIFSCAMFSGASWTTLDKNLTCPVLSQEYLANIDQGVFPVQCCLDPLGQHCTRILHVQCCPKSIEITFNSIFSSAMLYRASWTTLHKDFTCSFFTYNVVPRVLWKHCTVFFSVQCCLDHLGQHCASILPVQFCPKSIKITLIRNFPCEVLSRASSAKLQKDFTSATFSQEY